MARSRTRRPQSSSAYRDDEGRAEAQRRSAARDHNEARLGEGGDCGGGPRLVGVPRAGAHLERRLYERLGRQRQLRAHVEALVQRRAHLHARGGSLGVPLRQQEVTRCASPGPPAPPRTCVMSVG